MSGVTASYRLRHTWLYALPGLRLPGRVACCDQIFGLIETFKHDFFAATGLYSGPRGLAVLKMNRRNDAFTIPLGWIGRFLGQREMRHYRLLDGISGVPKLIGAVGATGLMHDFVPGHPLGRDEIVSDTFFDELKLLLDQVHARDMAYVDLNKRQNILMGADGRPYLIDFQISLWFPKHGWRGWAPLQWLLRSFQAADHYHLLKHKRRLRPDLLSPEERTVVEQPSFWIRLHRAVAGPITRTRRRALQRLALSESGAVAGSGAK